MQNSRYLVAAIALASLLACDDNGPSAPIQGGQFDVAVSGALTAQARGPAWFGADTDETGNPIFGLVLGQDTAKYTIILAKDGVTSPAKGQYDIREPGTGGAGWDGIMLVADNQGFPGLFVADSGRITITESQTDKVRGSINVYASGLLNGQLASVRLQGSFDAKPAILPALNNLKKGSTLPF